MSNYKSKYSGPQVDAKLDEIAGKQDTLVSGTNIKTINNTSLLGSGNIDISGGNSDIFIAEYDVATYAEVLAAINANKRIIIKKTEDSTQNDVLYYVNKYETYNNRVELYAIGYNSYIDVDIYSDEQWYYNISRFKREDQLIKLIVHYDGDDDFYDIANKIQNFDDEIDTISFIKDPSYGFGLILSYSYSSTSSQEKIEFTALLNSMSNTLPYRIKYTVMKNSSTGNVTWSRSSTQLQDKLVSGTSIKTFNNQSLLGSGNISETDPVFVASAAYGISVSDITNWNSKSDFSGSFIDLTNKPTTLSGYGITDAQETLVSGTNIKTINNTSLLGSGNISVQETLVSGTNIKTINNISLLGAGNISVLDADSTLSAAKLTGAITNGVTATTQSSGDNSTKIATTAYVDGAISNLPEPMIFKGSLGEGGTITTLPAAASTNKGFTYKVITDGTYASQTAKVGDTFISDGTAWVLIPSGDEPSGTVTSVATGVGLTGGPVTSSGTIKVNLVSETSQGTIGTTDKLYAVGVDSTGALCVSVPWTGTVTSVATGSGLSGGPITNSGTISLATAFGDTVNPYGSKTANYVLAAPNGEAGVPTFRALVAADLPNGNWLNGTGVNSVALQNTIAQRKAQTVIGEYNIADTTGADSTARGTYAFIIGNGTAENAPSNAFTVDWYGAIRSYSKDYERDTGGSVNDGIQFCDKNGDVLAYMKAYCPSDGQGGYDEGFNVGTSRVVGGSTIWNTLRMFIKEDGSPLVTINQPAAWRTGLGLDDLVISDTFTIDDIEIAASGVSGVKTKNVAKSGYTPLMIQVHLSNASSSGVYVSGCCCYYQTLSGNTVTINIANRFTSAAKVKAIITVLYKAN